MWDRKQLKSRAKTTFKRNYWKCILISILFALFVGGAPGAASAWGARDNDDNQQMHQSMEYTETDDTDGTWIKEIDSSTREESEVSGWEEFRDDALAFTEGMSDAQMAAYLVTFLMLLLVIFSIAMVLIIALDILICNPLEVGCNRFFFKNLNEQAQVKEVAFAFDHNYKNVIKTMFFRDLYTFLWTLLFIIPGIVKGYEYQMIPYLLADNPQMTKEQAFAESRRMMSGQKWRAFVLDLSFLGWRILSLCTFGILNVFYVQPYIDASHAALYEALRYHMPENTVNVQ